MRRAALYLRQSLDRSGEALAVARQEEDCRALAADRGWEVVRVHVDNDTGATTGRVRRGYRSLLDDIRAGTVDAVVTWAADRLHRRPDELEDFIALADERGIALATVSGELDLATPAGRLVARLLGSVSKHEVEHKGERQRRANLQRARKGDVGFTRRPFGFDTSGLVEHEAAEIRAMARSLLAGHTLQHIAADLNSRGVTTSTGARWTVPTVRRVLLNPRTAGLAAYRGDVLGRGNWTAIVDEDTHYALVAYLTDGSRRTSPSNRVRYLLSGLLRCGRCGGQMFASPAGRPGAYYLVYKCHRAPHLTRLLEPVEDVVVAAVIGRLSRPDARDLFSTPDTKAGVSELTQVAEQIRGRLESLALAFAEGALTTAQLRAGSERLRERLEQVEAERALAAGGNVLAPLLSADDVRGTWDQLPLGARRGVIDVLMAVTILPAGKGVRFSEDQVQIQWRS